MNEIGFSIIIPTYNRPEQLHGCLEALSRLSTRVADFEVIVVDDGSWESMEMVTAGYAGKFCIHLVRASHGGPAAARNAGVAVARGEYLAFIDDDCRVDGTWLEALKRCFSENPSALVGGGVKNGLWQNLFSSASQALVDFLYTHFAHQNSPYAFFSTSNLAVPADLIRKLGGFNSRETAYASEDREFCDRWKREGLPLVHCPEAQVTHVHALDAFSFTRQHLLYGRGAFNFHKARVGAGVPPLKGGSRWFFVEMLAYPFSAEPAGRALVIASLLVWARVIYLLGYVLQWLEAKITS